MRKITFVNEEYYHIYNRGVDKRTIFERQEDLERFFESMEEFNTIEPIGSIYENSLARIRDIKQKKKFGSSAPKLSKKKELVEFICYNLLPNHYHFILKQVAGEGIAKFMHKLGTGYTNYFNEKYKRSGSLCQGKYQAIHIGSDRYLLHLSVYINLNHKVHNLEKFGSSAPKLFSPQTFTAPKFGSSAPKLLKSSWDEYVNESKNKKGFCEKDIILDQFGSVKDYKEFAEDSLKRIRENKAIKKFLLEY